MKLYTSNFASAASLPDTIIPVSIALKTPDAYTGRRYIKLAPTPRILHNWRTEYNKDQYISDFNREVLSKLDPAYLYDCFEKYFGGKDICFLCYEKPGDFCHRKLVAKWFSDAGYPVEEWVPRIEGQVSLF